jgi:hypothetical protein
MFHVTDIVKVWKKKCLQRGDIVSESNYLWITQARREENLCVKKTAHENIVLTLLYNVSRYRYCKGVEKEMLAER